MNFLCIAKDKKTITENDLNLALQKSQDEKMPVLLICRGEMNKKAVEKLWFPPSPVPLKGLKRMVSTAWTLLLSLASMFLRYSIESLRKVCKSSTSL